jgi:tetratricopeptide (TPR) repeat protein
MPKWALVLGCVAVGVSLVCAPAAADTIYLKNGTSLVVDRAREKDGQVEYVMGGTTYRVPKNKVERIEAGGAAAIPLSITKSNAVPPPAGASGRPGSQPDLRIPELDLPAPPPSQQPANSALRQQILNLGQVDTRTLAALEQSGNADLAAAANLEAARVEAERGDFDRASRHVDRGLTFRPEHPILLLSQAVLLLRAGRPMDAVRSAERGARAASDSPDAYGILGYAYYKAEKPAQAIRAWKRALELHPDEGLRAYLQRVERETAVEENFREQESSHFSLRYDGRGTSLSLQRQLLSTLEAQYRELNREFDYAPRENIFVILYTQKAFFDVTEAPLWSGGGYDGKLRIPVEGVENMTPMLERVLKHELAHSFVSHRTNGRCPMWLHEGLAQMMEPRSLREGAALAEVFKARKHAPLRVLEGGFGRLSPQQAHLAYAESLAVVEYLRSRYGMSDLLRLLDRLATGASPEAALRATYQMDYEDLEAQLGAYLAKNYGQ